MNVQVSLQHLTFWEVMEEHGTKYLSRVENKMAFGIVVKGVLILQKIAEVLRQFSF